MGIKKDRSVINFIMRLKSCTRELRVAVRLRLLILGRCYKQLFNSHFHIFIRALSYLFILHLILYSSFQVSLELELV